MVIEYVFKAFDGTRFEDKDECEEYELIAGLPEGTTINNLGTYNLSDKNNTFHRTSWETATFIVLSSAAELELFMRLTAQGGYTIPFIKNYNNECYKEFVERCHQCAIEQSYPLILEYDEYDDEWKDYDKETNKIYDNRIKLGRALLVTDATMAEE